jgi:hypothetical protein
MRTPAQCPRCREVDERRQSMYEVSSGKRSHELHPVYLHEMDAADVHSGKLTLPLRARPHDRRHVAHTSIRAAV